MTFHGRRTLVAATLAIVLLALVPTACTPEDIATIAIALAAFALSIYNAVTSLLNTSNAAWVEHNKFFLEIDKQLAASPKLWAIYNEYKTMANPACPDEKLKRKAILYMYINAYDSIFHFYKGNRLTRLLNKLFCKLFRRQNTLDYWHHFYKQMYDNGSDEFRELVDEIIEKHPKHYRDDFVTQLAKLRKVQE